VRGISDRLLPHDDHSGDHPETVELLSELAANSTIGNGVLASGGDAAANGGLAGVPALIPLMRTGCVADRIDRERQPTPA